MQTLAWGDQGQASRVHQAESWFCGEQQES